MTQQDEYEIAKYWYRQGVLDTVKDVNPEGIDNDFEMIWKHIVKSPIERMFTLKEVLEIAENFYSFGIDDCLSIDAGEDTTTPDKKQYFFEKFGVDV